MIRIILDCTEKNSFLGDLLYFCFALGSYTEQEVGLHGPKGASQLDYSII